MAGTTIISVWEVKKLRHREVNELRKVPWLVSGGARIQTWTVCLVVMLPPWEWEIRSFRGVFQLAHLCSGSEATSSYTGSSGLSYTSPMHFRRAGFCLLAWSWPWQHHEARSEEQEVPPLLLTCQEPPGPEPATPREELQHPGPAVTHGHVLSQQHSQALSWKLTRGCQWRKSLNFLLYPPWLPPIPTIVPEFGAKISMIFYQLLWSPIIFP